MNENIKNSLFESMSVDDKLKRNKKYDRTEYQETELNMMIMRYLAS